MRIPLAALALVWPLSTTLAQDIPQLTSRSRLRVTVTGPQARAQVGVYQALTDTTLVLSAGSSPLTFPLNSISRLELSRGHKASIPGGVVGFILGGAAGGVIGCAVNTDDYGVFCAGQDDTKVYVGAALGGAIGAALGAFLFRRERWSPIDLAALKATHR